MKSAALILFCLGLLTGCGTVQSPRSAVASPPKIQSRPAGPAIVVSPRPPILIPLGKLPAGYNWSVEGCTNLSAPQWQPLPSSTANGTVTVTNHAAVAFFRMKGTMP